MLPAAGTKTGGYVPPSLKNRQPGEVDTFMQRRREENSLRVTNLSEDTHEDDLRVGLAASPFCSSSPPFAAFLQSLIQQQSHACVSLLLLIQQAIHSAEATSA